LFIFDKEINTNAGGNSYNTAKIKMNTIAKTQQRTSWEICSMIRSLNYATKVRGEIIRPLSWLTRFTTEKENYFKQVHVIQDKAYLMLMSTKSDKNGMFITGSLEYNLDNLPNFIKRHIDFSEIEKAKGTLQYRAFGLYFREGKLIPRK
jgi:hypothetical protein